jgi:tetratricopeptide (TPR) repeat protein
VRYLRGQFEKSIEAFLQSAKVLDEMGEVHSSAKTYNNLGLVYKQMGDYAPMEESLRTAIANYREAGDKAGERLPLANLGLFHQQVGRFDEAKHCFDDILNQLEPGENQPFEAKARLSLAQVHSSIGSIDKAVNMAEQALMIFTDINDKQGQAETMSLLGDIAIDNGQYNLAKEYHKRSLKLKEEIGSEMGICHSKLRLARVAMHEAKFDIALGLAREVTDKARKKGWTKLTIEGITETIRALSERDGPTAALKVLKENRAYEGMVGDPAMVLLDYNLTAAQAYLDNGLAAEALRHLNAFEEYYSRVMNSINDPEIRNGFAAKMERRTSLAGELRNRLRGMDNYAHRERQP